MEIYDCKVLLGGSRDNEVRKRVITAPEVIVLKHIHGEDHVIEVKHVGTSEIDNAQVRNMLALTYADGADPKNAAILREVFGPATMPLPTRVDGVTHKSKAPDIPVENVTRWREMRPEIEVRADAPSFAD